VLNTSVEKINRSVFTYNFYGVNRPLIVWVRKRDSDYASQCVSEYVIALISVWVRKWVRECVTGLQRTLLWLSVTKFVQWPHVQNNFEFSQLDFELTFISSVYEKTLFSSDVTARILVVTVQHNEKHTFVLNLHDKRNTHIHYSHTFGCLLCYN
jgi:hypothetical protein